MRTLLAALLATTALPALADTLPATSRITDVTVYPQGAKITREVTFTLPGAGPHELLVTDLPAATDAALMRLAGEEGVTFGAFSLRADRLPPRDPALTPAQQAARDTVDQAEAAVRTAQATVDAVRARIRAAEAQAGFLTSFSGAVPDGTTPETLRAMAEAVGAGTLAAAEAVAAAQADLWPAEDALKEAQEALAKAQAAYDALPAGDQDYTALVVAVEAQAAGETTLTMTYYVDSAGWRPSYDLYLTRQGGEALTIDRSVLVTQYTGEDWSGVNLTLSSSRPSEQAAPSALWPELRWIEKERPPADMAREMAPGSAAMPEMEAVAAPAPIVAAAAMEGDTVVYPYPRPVDVASGVEDLRLALDRIEAAPVVTAVAVPRWDKTAFVQAEFVNTSGEPLLPGAALLYREGVLVGAADLGLIAAGAEATLAFGALDQIVVRRDMPVRDSGQKGVFTTSNEQTETAVLTIENLGDEEWPVRVLDQIPYSEQQDLRIEPALSPQASETDVDGQRGILAWDFELPGGQKKDISVSYTLSWPEGMDLR
ncbi:DUF4139 domain-containing protein [Neotabrizicola sp. VNH66]|uniref:DUF4139 domain-containing protein n=1 Tax=Neotabrizicola sp. VNH66 TaxID=3400918 RepID=UPI003C0568DE